MAGILANSVSRTMVSGDTAVSNTVSGYAVSEQITLAASPAGTDYSWTLSRPSGTTSRSDLSVADESSSYFTPESEGTYLVTVDVDGTTYTIQIGVLAAANTNAVQVLRLQPLADASVATPSTSSLALYNSNESSALVVKNSAGTIRELATSLWLRRGAGTPEGAESAPVGTLYQRTDGGASTTLYVKESGSGNTGWIAK